MKNTWKLQLLAAVALSVAFNFPAKGQTSTSSGIVPDMSVKGFTRRPDFSDVQISPDGTHFAALVPNDDKPYENMVAIFDTQTHRPVAVMRSGRSLMFDKYFWANNTRLVTSVASRRGGFDTPALTGELIAFDADGGNGTELFGGRSRNAQTRNATWNEMAFPITTEPSSTTSILVATKAFSDDRQGVLTQAMWLDMYSGSEQPLMESPDPNATLYADHNQKVRLAFTYSGTRRNVLWAWSKSNRRGPNTVFLPASLSHVYSPAVHDVSATPLSSYGQGQWKIVNDPAVSGVMLTPIGFARDNTSLYVRIERRKSPESIGLFSLLTHQMTILFQGEFANPGELLPTADGQDFYAVISHDGQKSIHYFDENSVEARLNRALAVNFPGQLAYFSSFSRDGKRAIVTVKSDRNPGDFYEFNLETLKVTYLVSAQPWIDPKQTRSMQPIVMQARDGLTLHGFLTLPVGSKPFPLVVLPHGGPINVSDTWTYDDETQLLASRGYAVLQINYRGSGGQGIWFQSLSFRQWGLSMQDDLTDATKWAMAQGYADPNRICIYGASYGAYAALEGVVKEPDLYKCAIGYDGTYDLRVQVSKSDTEKTDNGDAYLRAALGDDQDDLLRRSPLSGVAKIKANILLLHGGEDLRTPYDSFKEFTKALDHQDKSFEKLVERHEGHGFYLPEHRLEAYEKIVEFLDRNIGPTQVVANAKPTASP